jgi:hypothetical protein
MDASIVSVVVAMDARAYSSFIARAFWFFFMRAASRSVD